MKDTKNNDIPLYIAKGNVVYIQLGVKVGSEQQGNRLGIVVQNNKGNMTSSTTIVVPLTSATHKADLPTHHKLFKVRYNFLNKDSIALCEQILTIDKQRIIKTIGSIDEFDMAIIDNCLAISLGRSK